MNIYALLHFEHKNDVTMSIELHRDTRLNNDCDVILGSKCNRA